MIRPPLNDPHVLPRRARYGRHLAGLLLALAVAACGGGGGGDPPVSSTSSSSSGGSPAVGVAVAPPSATIHVGTGTMTFVATVTNSTDTAVSWQVNGVTGGNATFGTISTGGVYAAPASLPAPATFAVTAVAAADPTKTASSAVTLTVATPPSVPTGLSSSGLSTSGVTLTWAASSDGGGSSVAGYYVYRNGTQVASVTSGTSYADSGLSPSTNYSYQVAAFDTSTPPLVSAQSAALAITTLSAPDTQAPTVPTGLAASSIATGSIALTWNASTDLPNPGGTGIGGYYVYRNGTQIATVTTGTTYTDTPLTASTTYSYQVAAFDNAANVSQPCTAVPLTTLADTAAPTVPTGLTSSNVTPSSATISWNASTDLPIPGATGVGGYYVIRNGSKVGTTSSTSFTDNGLTVAMSYNYTVEAFDKVLPAPNVSAASSPLGVTAGNTLTITPRNAALTLQQTQQFSSNAGAAVTWSVDAVSGGNSTVGTISNSGLYTPPSSPGVHTVKATSSTNSTYFVTAAVAVTDLTGVTTWHNDGARTGQNLQEYALTPATVRSGFFGKRWSCALDGLVYAQPLYVANLSIPNKGTHNVLFVATMNDSVYAFDADDPGCTIYWQDSFTNPGAGITTQSSADANCGDNTVGNVEVGYGITGTPVIDPIAQTIYLVAATTDNGTNYQRLHALNLATGADRAGSPVAITATVPGTGDGGTTVAFNPLYQNQRPALALTGGGVVIGWSAHCDNYLWPWHGWIMRYNATSLARTAAFAATPNGERAGIWMSGGAPALDTDGNMFLSTGNGTFDATNNVATAPAPNNDYGESFINLSPTTLAVQDFYTPSQNALWTTNDLDISSAGITVLPDGAGPSGHPNVLIGADKQGHLWMIDRNSMSGFSPIGDNTVQYLTLPNTASNCASVDPQCVYSTPAFSQATGTIYIAVELGPVMALKLSSGLIPQSGQVAIAASESAETYGYPSPTPAISASPSGGAIVWVLDNDANGTDNGSATLGPAVLRAYDANNLGSTLYSSDRLGADTGGDAAKFTLPVIANGHVYVGGDSVLTVYGLAP